jgi:chromosome segregation ATPase
LESLVRLSEGLARLYSESHVEKYHVEEAVRLLRTSITKVAKDSVTIGTTDAEEKKHRERLKRAQNQEKSTRALIDNIREKGDIMFQSVRRAKHDLEVATQELEDIDKEISDLQDIMDGGQSDIEASDMLVSEINEKLYDLQKRRDEQQNKVALCEANHDTLKDQLDKERDTIDRLLRDMDQNAEVVQAQDQDDDDEEVRRPKKTRKVQKQKTMDIEEYRRISFKLLRYIHSNEVEDVPITRPEVINWYVTSEAKTHEDAKELSSVLGKIIDRLVNKDNFLLEMTDDPDKNSRPLIVTPNVNLDDFE